MITILSIIGIVCLVLGVIFVNLDIRGLDFLFGVVGAYLISGIIMYNTINRKLNREPTAMDVYKGKTTLEITYKDSIAIDSVVVFKK